MHVLNLSSTIHIYNSSDGSLITGKMNTWRHNRCTWGWKVCCWNKIKRSDEPFSFRLSHAYMQISSIAFAANDSGITNDSKQHIVMIFPSFPRLPGVYRFKSSEAFFSFVKDVSIYFKFFFQLSSSNVRHQNFAASDLQVTNFIRKSNVSITVHWFRDRSFCFVTSHLARA